MLKKIGVTLLVLVVAIVAFALYRSATEPRDLWISLHTFPACPSRPSCVSSVATDEVHRINPLHYAGDLAAGRQKIESVVRAMPLTTIEQETPQYLHVLFRTPTMHFRDDVELLVEDSGTIQVRSISRFGYGDHGVNRARVEAIRAALDAMP